MQWCVFWSQLQRKSSWNFCQTVRHLGLPRASMAHKNARCDDVILCTPFIHCMRILTQVPYGVAWDILTKLRSGHKKSFTRAQQASCLLQAIIYIGFAPPTCNEVPFPLCLRCIVRLNAISQVNLLKHLDNARTKLQAIRKKIGLEDRIAAVSFAYATVADSAVSTVTSVEVRCRSSTRCVHTAGCWGCWGCSCHALHNMYFSGFHNAADFLGVVPCISLSASYNGI